jgi:uncharacterized membrane protein
VRAVLAFLKSTLLAGIVFLLPIGLVAIVLGKLLSYAHKLGGQLHARLFPGVESDFIPLAFAALALLAVAFAAGVLARTSVGRRIFRGLEGAVLANVPAYTVVRQAVTDMSGGSVQLTAGTETRVVLVRLDDMSLLGLLIERRPDGTGIVYLPDAPSALSGSVAMVTADRLSETTLKPADLLQRMRRLGAGLAALD